MAENSPVAEMYIKATAGDSLRMLAQEVKSFIDRQENRRIKVGFEVTPFNDAKMPVLINKLGATFMREMKATAKLHGINIADFINIDKGGFSKVGDVVFKQIAKSMDVTAGSIQLTTAVKHLVEKSMGEGILQGMVAAEEKASRVAKGVAKRFINRQFKEYRDGVAAEHRAMKAQEDLSKFRDKIPLQEDNRQKELRKFIENRFSRFKKEGMSVPDAANKAMTVGARAAEIHYGMGNQSVAAAEYAGRAVLAAKKKAEDKEIEQLKKAEDAKASAVVAAEEKRLKAEQKAADKRLAAEEKTAAKTAKVIQRVRAQQDVAGIRRSDARKQSIVDDELEYMKKRQKETEKSAKEIEAAQKKAEAADAKKKAKFSDIDYKEDAEVRKIRLMQRLEESKRRSYPSLSARAERDIVEPNLYGMKAINAARESRNEAVFEGLSDIRKLAPGPERRAERERFLRDAERAYAPYLNTLEGMSPQTIERMSQQAFRSSSAGSVTGLGNRPDEIRTALENARKEYADLQRHFERRATTGPDFAKMNAEAKRAAQGVFDLDRKLEEHKRIVADIERLSSKNRGGIFGHLDAQKLKSLRNQMDQLIDPAQGKNTSAHGLNFAMMNAAYGFQDFFQVLAQPGMGLGRAFLAAANNIGPALGIMAGSAVGANVAVGALLAGMAGLSMVMGKEDESAKRVKESIDRLAEAYRRADQASRSFRIGIQPLGVSVGGEGYESAVKEMLGTGSKGRGISRAYEFSANKNENKGIRRTGSWTDWIPGIGPDLVPDAGSLIAERFFNDFSSRRYKASKSDEDFITEAPLSMNQLKEKYKGLKEPSDLGRQRFGGRPNSSIIAKVREERKAAQAVHDEFMEKGGGADMMRQRIAEINAGIEAADRLRMSAPEAPGRIAQGVRGSIAREAAYGPAGHGIFRESVRSAVGLSRNANFAAESAKVQLEDFDATGGEEKRRLKGRIASNRSQIDAAIASGARDQIEIVNRLNIENQTHEKLLRILEKEEIALKKNVEATDVYAKAMAKLPDAIAGVVGAGREIASLFMPGFDRGGILASQRRDEEQRIGTTGIRKLFGGMNPADKAFFDLRAQALQFGDTFADIMSKMQSVKTDFGAFRALNFGNQGRNVNAAISAGLDMGKAADFDLETMPMSMQRVARQAEVLRKNLDELAAAEPNAANAIAKMKMRLAAIQLQKEQAAIANDPLMQSINAVNRYATEIVNLNESMAEGAILAKQRGLTEKQGRLIRLEESLGKLGFNQSLERQIGDFDQMVSELVKKMIAAGAPQADIDRVQAQAAQRRFDMFAGGPNEQARRQNQGGFVDNFRYGNNTGKMLNFNDRIRGLQEKLQKDLMQPGLDDAGRANLQASHRKSVEREIAGMVSGMGTGKATLMDSGSVWQRIQESLSGNSVTQIEEQQLDILRKIHEDLQAGKHPGGAGGGVFRGMLKPADVKNNIQGQGGPLDGIVLGGALGFEQGEARLRGEKEAKDLAKKKKEADLADLEGQLDEELVSISMQKPGSDFDTLKGLREEVAGEDNSKDAAGNAVWFRQAEKDATDAGDAGLAERHRLRAEAYERAAKRKKEIEDGQVQGFGAMPQNVDGMAQAGMGGVSSQEMTRQNALLEKIASNGERAITESTRASEKLVEAIENSGLVIV